MFRWFQHLQIVWKILTGQSRVNGRENCESSCQQLLKEEEEAQRTISEKEIRVQFSARYERSKILTICNYNETCQYTSVFFWPLRPAGQRSRAGTQCCRSDVIVDSPLHNVYIVQYVFLPTEQSETYFKNLF